MITTTLNHLWHWSSRPAAHRFACALDNPGAVQRTRLTQLVRRHSSTAFGKQFRFTTITTPHDFQRTVPLQTWNDVSPWVERIRGGEAEVLTTDPVTRLIPTGGSTGGCKLIPWTRGLAREFAAVIAPWVVDLQRQHPGVMNGPAYWSVTPKIQRADTGVDILIGFDNDSAYLGGMLSQVVRRVFAVPECLRMIPNLDTFRYVTLRCLLACSDLRLISVWHPSFLGLLLDTALLQRERFIRDIATGGCSERLPSAVLQQMGPWLRADRQRAHYLENVDWSAPRNLWPHLALVSCWADAAAAIPAAALRQRIDGVPLQAKGLLATEGVISIPWHGQHVAAVTGPVLEFIDTSGQILWIDQLTQGESYEVVITTAGGLWRYRLGDRVYVDGFMQKTPCLRFLGRTGSVCDLVGEKLEEGFVATCLAQVIKDCSFALLAPNSDQSLGYTLFADRQVDEAVLTQLDLTLSTNPQWRLARSLGQLQPIRYQRVGNNASLVWMTHQAQVSNAILGSIKPTVLDADRHWSARFAAKSGDSL